MVEEGIYKISRRDLNEVFTCFFFFSAFSLPNYRYLAKHVRNITFRVEFRVLPVIVEQIL